VQTTLLGIAIALILALVTALVGPLFVDWSSYRGEFETHAKALTGLDLRITGAIDARLLPTPSLTLHGIELGRPQDQGSMRARALRLEFALGPLARGEWRVTDAQLEGPELAAQLDRSGRMAMPAPKAGFDVDAVAIERLVIEDGRAVLTDAASGSRLTLEKFAFKGELRSLAGPLKGEGSFVAGGWHNAYRVSISRVTEDGGVKVRVSVDPTDRPLKVDVDVAIRLEQGAPRFDGQLQVVRAIGRAPADTPQLITEPWRLSSRIKGDSTAAVLEQVEIQYGSDERAIKLRGTARLNLGAQPGVNAVLTSPQIDIDRVLALPDASRRRPVAALKALGDALGGAVVPPVPTTLSIALESVTLAGAVLQRVGAEINVDGDRLDIASMEFRAPGITQVRLGGRLSGAGDGLRFAGAVKVEAGDPRALLAWLTERSDLRTVVGPLRVGGELTLGSDAIVIDRLDLDLDRVRVAGRLAYAFAADNRPARLDAVLTAPDLDLDHLQGLATAALGDVAADWPREAALSLKIARARVAGVEAKEADIDMRIDGDAIDIRRLAVADFGGARLAAKGRIDSKGPSPGGELALDLDARSLDGVATLVERLAPQMADQLRRSAARVSPAVLRAVLAVQPAGAGNAVARVKLDGRAGGFRLALQGDGTAVREAFKVERLDALRNADINISGRLESDDGAAMAELVGVDRWLVVEKRPGRLTLNGKGRLDGEVAIDGRFTAGTLDASAGGKVRLAGTTAAGLEVKIANASLRSLRPVVGGRAADPLPATMSLKLELDGDTLRVGDLKGAVAGAPVNGRLTLGLAQSPYVIEGALVVGTVDLASLIATVVGVPVQGASARTGGLWPAEPFERGVRGLAGRLEVKSARVALTPKLAVTDFTGAAHFGDGQFALQVNDGRLAGGRLAGDLIFLHTSEGVVARSHVKVTGANAAELLPGDGTVTGRLTLDLSAEGTGLSPVALAGSLTGSGMFRLDNGKLVRLDPGAFRTVIRAVDQGLPIEAGRVRDRTEAALASGVLAVNRAEGSIAINAGQARLQSNPMLATPGADLAVTAGLALADGELDVRLVLTGPPVPGAPANTQPAVAVVLRGPFDSPKRTIDVTGFASWLALRAVDQQSRKLDALEGRDVPTTASPAVNGGVESTASDRTPAPVVAPPRVTPAGPKAPEVTAPDSSVPARSEPAAPSEQRQKSALPPAERTQTASPPMDLRPRSVQPSAGGQGAAKPPPTPARPRSLSEILFGR
jgi:large subunit ribosomal protein L24